MLMPIADSFTCMNTVLKRHIILEQSTFRQPNSKMA